MATVVEDSLAAAEVSNGLSPLYKTPIIILAVTVLWLFWSASSYFRARNRLPYPPGSSGFPIIGDTIEFAKATKTAVGIREWMMGKARKYGPFFKWQSLAGPIVIMDPPAGNKFLFQNEGKLLENRWPSPIARLLGDALPTKVGEVHKLARRHLGGFFDHAAVIRYIDGVNRGAIKHFADHWEGKEELVAMDMTTRFTFSTMLIVLVSLEDGCPELDELYALYTKWTFDPAKKLPINLPGFAFYDALKARESIQKFWDKIMARRRQELAEGRVSDRAKVDVLNKLLTLPDESGNFMSDESIKDNLLVLLFAGFVTTNVTLAMIILYVGKNPHVYEQLVQEHKSILEGKRQKGKSLDTLTQWDLSAMKYTWGVIQEVLRLQPPLSAGLRIATTDFEYNGYLVPKGWLLMWNNQLSHYDPKFFKDPLTFDPSRWEVPPTPFTFIPFGGGPRLCLGYEFGKMELLVFVHNLLRRYRWTPVYPDEPIMRDPLPSTEKGIPIKLTRVTSF